MCCVYLCSTSVGLQRVTSQCVGACPCRGRADANCCFLSVCLQRDLSFVKQEFVKVYMSSVYFLLHSPSLPRHRWAHPPSEEQRARAIYATLDSLKHQQHTTGQSGCPEVYVDPMHPHLAFDITELTFDLLHVARG